MIIFFRNGIHWSGSMILDGCNAPTVLLQVITELDDLQKGDYGNLKLVWILVMIIGNNSKATANNKDFRLQS